jgi:hypothetical protein
VIEPTAFEAVPSRFKSYAPRQQVSVECFEGVWSVNDSDLNPRVSPVTRVEGKGN